MIRVDARDAVVTVELGRPDKRNALTPEMLDELGDRVAAIDAEARAVLLCGAGSVFCAGFDLRRCAEDPGGDTMRALLVGLSRAIAALRALHAPVVAAAHGAAIAGGCALLGGADLVITDRAAKLGYPVVRIGVSPGVSGPALAGRVGLGPARVRLLDPGLIDGAEAGRIGLADEVVASAPAVRDRAAALARALADKPAPAIEATRRWVDELESRGRAGAAADALDASLAIVGNDDERARLEAMWRR